MPSPADDLRTIRRGLEPVRRMVATMVQMDALIAAAIEAADRVAALEHRQRELEEAVRTLEATITARSKADEEARAIRREAIAVEVRHAETEAAQIKERVARETRDFITARQSDREHVGRALAAAQQTLGHLRAALDQAKDEQRQLTEESTRARANERAAREAELQPLEAKIATLKKEYREIQERLTALVR